MGRDFCVVKGIGKADSFGVEQEAVKPSEITAIENDERDDKQETINETKSNENQRESSDTDKSKRKLLPPSNANKSMFF